MVRKLAVLTLGALLILSGQALSAEKSVIIGFKQRPGRSERALVQGARGTVRRSFRLIHAMAARLPEEQIERLRENRRIAYIEENAVYTAAQGTPSDEERDDSWGVRRIAADVAHASGNKGTGVKVAIIDTGIDYTHEDLDDNYQGGYDFVFNDDDPFDDSFNGHGTHVAGIVAAEANGIGVVGVAPEADLYAVKVLDGAGFGTEEWIIAGIDWAVSNGMQIISLSLEGPDRQGLRDACDRARQAGVLVVAAGGNSLIGGGPVEYPAAYESVIAVTATDMFDMTGYFSPIGMELELAAPGVDILSTVSGGGYDLLSGTSQAAPHVVGAAALYLLANTVDFNADGLVDSEDVRLILQLSSTDLGAPGFDSVYGYGLVDAAAASFGSAPPVADPGGPYTGHAGHAVQFDGSGSSDPDGSISAYLWDFGDGGCGQGPTPTHIYDAVGTYLVTLSVTDDDGQLSEATTTVEITEESGPPGNAWTLAVLSNTGPSDIEFRLEIEDFGGILWFDETFPGGQVAFGLGYESNGIIFWFDSLGALFYGMVDHQADTMMGIVFDFMGDPADDTIFFGEK